MGVSRPLPSSGDAAEVSGFSNTALMAQTNTRKSGVRNTVEVVKKRSCFGQVLGIGGRINWNRAIPAPLGVRDRCVH